MPYNHSIKNPATSGIAYTGRADGIFSLNEQVLLKAAELWATAISPPSAPTITSVTPGNAQATITFTAPSSLNGSTITVCMHYVTWMVKLLKTFIVNNMILNPQVHVMTDIGRVLTRSTNR
jgi:hypothetical protein